MATLILSLAPISSPLLSLLRGINVVSGQSLVSQVSSRNHFDLENGNLKEDHSFRDYDIGIVWNDPIDLRNGEIFFKKIELPLLEKKFNNIILSFIDT